MIKNKYDYFVAEKVWRLDVANTIDKHVKKRNFDLGQSLDERHSRKDIKLFRLNRLFYVQEDVFKYFYPFCLINVPLSSVVVLRRVLKPS